MTRIVLASQNLGSGATRMDAHPGMPGHLAGADRWRNGMLPERLATIRWRDGTESKPTLLGLNECTGWDEDRLQAAASDLGMAPVGFVYPTAGNPSALLYDPDQIDAVPGWNRKHGHAAHHGLAVAAVPDPALPQPIGLTVAHLSPFSPITGTAEANLAAARAYAPGGTYAAVIGDINNLPHYRPTWDRSVMMPYNNANRLLRPRPFYWEPRTRLGRLTRAALLALMRERPNVAVSHAFRAADLHDAAAVMHRRTGDRSYLAWTCPSMRIDWILLSEALLPALVDYQVLDSPPWASDHHGVAALLETERADTAADTVRHYH